MGIEGSRGNRAPDNKRACLAIAQSCFLKIFQSFLSPDGLLIGSSWIKMFDIKNTIYNHY
jgi:hypothetical protein